MKTTRREFLGLFSAVAGAIGLSRFVRAEAVEAAPKAVPRPCITFSNEHSPERNPRGEVLTITNHATGKALRYCLPDMPFMWQMQEAVAEAYEELGVAALIIGPDKFVEIFSSFVCMKPPYTERHVIIFQGGWSDYGMLHAQQKALLDEWEKWSAVGA
jgi:hypothetical protein